MTVDQDGFNAVALCAVGAEKAAANEIRRLGLAVLDCGPGRARFRAGVAGLYRALIALRTADRVLLEAARFDAPDFDALFEGVRDAPWEDLVPAGLGVRVVKARTRASRLRAETSVQAVVHKAAAERLCAARGLRRLPDDGAAAELRVYVERDQARVLLDLSGAPLSRRGYRTEGGAAPLRETTAAAVTLLAGWKRKFPLYDPFCGSGTIVIEAALYAWDAAPGLGRRFALERLALADPAVERAAREEFLGRVDFSRVVRVMGSDADERAVEAARANLVRAAALARGGVDAAGVGGVVNAGSWFRACPMEAAAPPPDWEPGIIITNPPYGRRLGSRAESEAIYAAMGGLRRRFPGWRLAVITDHPGFESFFGRPASDSRGITNGPVDCRLYRFD